MKHYIVRVFTMFIPLAAVITIMTGLVYVSVQQVIRQGANDPQIQMAEDAGALWASGEVPAGIVSHGPKTELADSLAPFIIVIDDGGTVLESSATLEGEVPVVPPGVLAYARETRQHRITWQPQPYVRQALVIQYIPDKGFIVAGRSLREAERRTQLLEWYAAGAWLLALATSLILIAGLEAISYRLRV